MIDLILNIAVTAVLLAAAALCATMTHFIMAASVRDHWRDSVTLVVGTASVTAVVIPLYVIGQVWS